MASQPRLSRSLGPADAIWIGLGSMIGAGLFSAFAPAAASAGAGLLVGLGVAALVAICNATSSAQLAAQYPTSGGTYVYGRERLGAWPGFVAGWCFVIGKTASCAAMALTFATYVAPAGWDRPVAAGAVLALVAVNYFGITRTARLTRLIMVVVLLAVVAALVSIGGQSLPHTSDWAEGVWSGGWYGILQSAGLLFFAFAGYARIATLGEEVRDPRRTIPIAVVVSLGIVLVLYAATAVVLLLALGPDELARSTSPLLDATAVGGWDAAGPLVRVGAAAASLGALLALVAGVGRTTLAMAREDDLPRWLAAVHPTHRVPHHAEIALAVSVVALVLLVDLRDAIGFSSFGVLLYYLVANVAAATQDADHRRYPVALQATGALGCSVLVITLPPSAIAGGVTVVAAGVAVRVLRSVTGRV